jgi:hypothetical protein
MIKVKEKIIEVPVWWKSGHMLYRRDCLPVNHPEHTYNYMRYEMGITPEDYGVFMPYKCEQCGHINIPNHQNQER